MVSDSGGFDDKSFNQTSHKGLTDAKSQLGVQTGEVESTTTADFAKNIKSMVDAKCNVIITVGFLLADDTVAAAKANPNVNFAIVDSQPDTKLPNLKPLAFNTAESSFLAGYVAASQSKTGKVGTFGGKKIPTVTIFMDGFAQGVAHYNKAKSKNVQVLGWDSAKQDGQFVPGERSFEDVNGGKNTANGLVAQGADVIFPVAGPAGEGGLQAAQASGGKVNAIWVDTDGCVSAQNYCKNLITSVEKAMDVAVFEAIKAGKEGKFNSEAYVGNLKNKGTKLSPYHEFDSKVTAETKAEVEKLATDIQAGTVKIESSAQPK
ncbi:BMP family ABC transporter substrate-binding protein [Naumannella sp. ID2617S]|uniref:BMP family ABC transporter substrate-binding protein n=2 Tax=Enemella dayhoffiae TaxID=2016507 RepID=A0A255H0U8_9ACTN|nr:BMP family ABC transporter substrate-binding protein [Naumannella sp. ID2617S]OYO21016.1 BMP family ABC transporter substrate-binding protein [Enemella dayhoffiae]